MPKDDRQGARRVVGPPNGQSGFKQQLALTNASDFFFERRSRPLLVTSRHVFCDEPSRHFPDRIEIEWHNDSLNVAQSLGLSILRNHQGSAVWRQEEDRGGDIDVAVIEPERAALPAGITYRAFTPQHPSTRRDHVEVVTWLLIVGFPLGFHDALHHLPVVLQP